MPEHTPSPVNCIQGPTIDRISVTLDRVVETLQQVAQTNLRIDHVEEDNRRRDKETENLFERVRAVEMLVGKDGQGFKLEVMEAVTETKEGLTRELTETREELTAQLEETRRRMARDLLDTQEAFTRTLSEVMEGMQKSIEPLATSVATMGRSIEETATFVGRIRGKRAKQAAVVVLAMLVFGSICDIEYHGDLVKRIWGYAKEIRSILP